MSEFHSKDEVGCGCHGGCDRREFLTAMGAATATALLASLQSYAGENPRTPRKKEGATVRAVALYPPSETFSKNPDGWWSWPGNEFDAEGHQKQYTAALAEMAQKLGMKIDVDAKPVAGADDALRVARELEASRPDGLLLIMFYNGSLKDADQLLATAETLGIPAVLFIGLGVKHGPVAQYRRPGIYFIQSLDNLAAIESGMRMINTKRLLAQSRLLSINEAAESDDRTEPFLGVQVRPVPFARYADEFHKASLGEEAKTLITAVTSQATEIRGITREALENAARAHLVLRKLLAEEEADGVTMNCLRRGMLKPCISFATLNSQLIPAVCENDLPAAFGQLLGQLLTGRPGFQHNPCFDTEKNHYYASHCTCATRLYGPEGPELPYLLRRFAHTNEGSCAIQVFWKTDDPVTMLHYYPGETPELDIYAGKVVKSHPMPPAAGCTTNVEIEITDRPDACMVRGHHNVLFCGDFSRQFRLFAQLHKLKLAETGYQGVWPM